MKLSYGAKNGSKKVIKKAQELAERKDFKEANEGATKKNPLTDAAKILAKKEF
jgi:hypothetical protein